MSNLNESNEAITMESLHDYVLVEIFSYLDLENLKNSTLVCKNWNEVIGSSSRTMMKLKLQVHKIDVIEIEGSDSQCHRQYRNVAVSKLSFEEAVDRLQQFDLSQVKKLTFNDHNEALDGKLFVDFLSRMPLLENLVADFIKIRLDDSGMPTVQLPKLKKLVINSVASNCLDCLSIENLEELIFSGASNSSSYIKLKRYKKLKKLELNDIAFSALFEGKNFEVTEWQLSSLTVSISTSPITDYEALLKSFKAFLKSQASSLTNLKIYICGDSSEKIITTISGELRTLTVLHLIDKSRDNRYPPLNFFKNFKPIESLKELACNSMLWNRKTQKEFFKLFPNIQTLILDNRITSGDCLDKFFVSIGILLLFRGVRKYLGKYEHLKRLRLETLIRGPSEFDVLLAMVKINSTLELLEIENTEMNDCDSSDLMERLLRETSLKHFKLRGSTKFLR